MATYVEPDTSQVTDHLLQISIPRFGKMDVIGASRWLQSSQSSAMRIMGCPPLTTKSTAYKRRSITIIALVIQIRLGDSGKRHFRIKIFK